MLSGKRIIPFMDWLYFRKTFTPHILDADGNIVLHLSDNYAEGPQTEPAWNELIGIGPLCRYFSKEDIGGSCLLPVMANHMFRLGDMMMDNHGDVVANEDWAIKEETLMSFAPFVCNEDK